MEMKRNSIIAAAVCLAALASCQKQEIVESPSLAKVDVELTASSDLNSTKTVMTEYNNHWWSVSDKISLFYKVDGTSTVRHSVFTSKNLIPSATARFAGTLSLPAEDTDLKTVSAIAVYPTAAEGASSDGTSVTVTVPAVQTAVEGTFMEGAYPVVAQTSDLTAALSFKAVCGGVKVSFQTPGITSFTFDGKDSKIAGTASVTFDADGNPVATTDESAVSVITVNAPAGGFEVGKWYYMTALPATLAGGYTIKLSNGKSFGSTSSIAIKRSVFGVLDAKDVETITYAPLADKLKPISWWDENKDYMVAPTHAAEKSDQYQWDNQGMKCRYIRFISDIDYIYGYYEGVVTSATYNDISTVGKLKNLGIWLDVDGKQQDKEGNPIVQGGGWLFNAYKAFDLSIYGPLSNSGNMEWATSLHTQTAGNDANIGALKKTDALPGYGEGVLENDVFKYSFVIDRRIVGVRSASSIVIGLCLDDGSIANFHVINPDRAGFIVPLKNSSSDFEDPAVILKKVRGVDEWGSVNYATITNKGNNRGDTRLKFDSDADYIYGYIEVPNTDNLYFKNGEYYEFCPGFIKRLAIGIDLDGVETGQGIGWPIGNCWETVLNGMIISCSRPLSDEDKALGWKDRWGHYIFPSDKFDPATIARPAYTITPEVWTPTLNDASAAEGFGTVKAGTEDWQYFATGKGEWKDKCFRYSFAIERNRLGLKDLTEVKLGVFMYEDGVSGYSNTPDAVGTTIKLNNN